MDSKKGQKRKRAKYPGLEKRLYSRIKQEFYDIDYVDKLNEEEKAWLNHFMNGHLGANTKDNPVITEYADKKKCWDANNARNRDVYNIKKVTGELADIVVKDDDTSVEFEDDLIEYLDEGKEVNRLLKELTDSEEQPRKNRKRTNKL